LRVISRNSAGVKLFDVARGEHVVSAARIEETEEEAEVMLADEEQTIAPDTGAVIGDDAAAGPEDGE